MFKYFVVFMFAVSSLLSIDLEEALLLSLKNDKQILSLDKQLKAKQKDLDIIYSKLYPTIDGTISRTKRDYIVNNRFESEGEEEYTTYRLSLSQVLFDKKIFESLGETELEVSFQGLKIEDKIQNNLLEILSFYTKALDAQNRAKLLEQKSKYYHFKKLQFSRMLEKSLITKDEFDKLIIEYNSALIEETKNKHTLNLLLKKLSNHTGVEIENVEEVDTVDFFKDIYNESLLMNNLSLKASQVEKNLYNKKISVARAGHYPTLSIQGDYTEFDAEEDSQNDYKQSQQIMLMLKVPFYAGGYNSSRTEQEILNLKASEHTYDYQKEQIENQYQELILNNRSLEEQISMYKDAIKHAHNYYVSVENSYKKSFKSRIDLEEAKLKYYQLEFDYKSTKISQLKNTLEIQYLFGNLIAYK